MSPRLETTQPLQTTCASILRTSWYKSFSLCWNGPSCISVCAPCLSSLHWNYWEECGSIFFMLSHQLRIHTEKIPPSLSFSRQIPLQIFPCFFTSVAVQLQLGHFSTKGVFCTWFSLPTGFQNLPKLKCRVQLPSRYCRITFTNTSKMSFRWISTGYSTETCLCWPLINYFWPSASFPLNTRYCVLNMLHPLVYLFIQWVL